jgi:hypothetical protein
VGGGFEGVGQYKVLTISELSYLLKREIVCIEFIRFDIALTLIFQ